MDREYCLPESTNPISHSFIDFRVLISERRLEMAFQREMEQYEFSPLQLAELIEEIMAQTSGEIEGFLVLINLIEYIFEQHTRNYFMAQATLHIVFYMTPLMIQIFYEEYTRVVWCNSLCIIVQLMFFSIELIQMEDAGLEYFQEIWNLVDLPLFLISLVYHILKLTDPGASYFPNEDATDV